MTSAIERLSRPQALRAIEKHILDALLSLGAAGRLSHLHLPADESARLRGRLAVYGDNIGHIHAKLKAAIAAEIGGEQ